MFYVLRSRRCDLSIVKITRTATKEGFKGKLHDCRERNSSKNQSQSRKSINPAKYKLNMKRNQKKYVAIKTTEKNRYMKESQVLTMLLSCGNRPEYRAHWIVRIQTGVHDETATSPQTITAIKIWSSQPVRERSHIKNRIDCIANGAAFVQTNNESSHIHRAAARAGYSAAK